MNGKPLPHLNGFPVRLIVPGWTATYWIKHLNGLTISSKPLVNFWMTTAYRVPAGMFPVDHPFPTQDNQTTWPITEMVVNSVVADPIEGAKANTAGFTVQGVAWDRGHGIRQVEVRSTTAGAGSRRRSARISAATRSGRSACIREGSRRATTWFPRGPPTMPARRRWSG